MFKTTACFLPLLFGATVLLTGCQANDSSPSTARVVLVQAATGTRSASAVYTGEIRARHETDLSFRVGGKLAARLVDAGAEIKAGQPLARLDPNDLELAAIAARAQLSAAESDYATARTDRDRYADLLSRKFVSQAAFDAKDNALNSASARLEQARAQSRITGNQTAYGTLSSGFPAIVTAVIAEAGQVVGAGQTVLRIARPDEKEVAISIPEGRIPELKAAKSLTVSLWAAPEIMMRGELRELSPAADPATRTYAARIRIPEAAPDVRLGMTARVALDSGAEASLLVPLSAVIDVGQGPLVRIVKDGKVISRPIQISRFREDGVDVAKGLDAGDLVIVTGAGKLVDGDVVQTKPLTPQDRQR